ncbi:uncharacterized protein LOC118191922 [Stegodyphus dumicola]|uniref:uncharacterized protein LOC118191922 n=1 Tax=Stegodyphus dumicola TaxID=202533 RepID=UPI0015AFB552|nr:uncharacterized protein LOC118191922 [Stegodyphus dumicola]
MTLNNNPKTKFKIKNKGEDGIIKKPGTRRLLAYNERDEESYKAVKQAQADAKAYGLNQKDEATKYIAAAKAAAKFAKGAASARMSRRVGVSADAEGYVGQQSYALQGNANL